MLNKEEQIQRKRESFINFGRTYGMQIEAKEFREKLPGTSLVVSDYSGVELRVLAGLADLEKKELRSGMNYNFGKLCRLRKSRSRMMLEALQTGACEKGNLRMYYRESIFTFCYRGTPILQWNQDLDNFAEIYSGKFELSPSTRNQRKMAREAIEEYKERVLN